MNVVFDRLFGAPDNFSVSPRASLTQFFDKDL